MAGFVLINGPVLFQVGDHVVTPKLLPTGQEVEHHGVVIEQQGRLVVVHKGGPFPIRVRVSTLEEFGHGASSRVRVVEDRTETRLTAEARARRMIGDRSYSLLSDNCEHFASWAVRDKRECLQIARDWPILSRPLLGHALGCLASAAVCLGSWYGAHSLS